MKLIIGAYIWVALIWGPSYGVLVWVLYLIVVPLGAWLVYNWFFEEQWSEKTKDRISQLGAVILAGICFVSAG